MHNNTIKALPHAPKNTRLRIYKSCLRNQSLSINIIGASVMCYTPNAFSLRALLSEQADSELIRLQIIFSKSRNRRYSRARITRIIRLPAILNFYTTSSALTLGLFKIKVLPAQISAKSVRCNKSIHITSGRCNSIFLSTTSFNFGLT